MTTGTPLPDVRDDRVRAVDPRHGQVERHHRDPGLDTLRGERAAEPLVRLRPDQPARVEDQHHPALPGCGDVDRLPAHVLEGHRDRGRRRIRDGVLAEYEWWSHEHRLPDPDPVRRRDQYDDEQDLPHPSRPAAYLLPALSICHDRILARLVRPRSVDPPSCPGDARTGPRLGSRCGRPGHREARVPRRCDGRRRAAPGRGGHGVRPCRAAQRGRAARPPPRHGAPTTSRGRGRRSSATRSTTRGADTAQLCVHPDARGAGIGTALATAVLADAPGSELWAFGNLPAAQAIATGVLVRQRARAPHPGAAADARRAAGAAAGGRDDPRLPARRRAGTARDQRRGVLRPPRAGRDGPCQLHRTYGAGLVPPGRPARRRRRARERCSASTGRSATTHGSARST